MVLILTHKVPTNDIYTGSRITYHGRVLDILIKGQESKKKTVKIEARSGDYISVFDVPHTMRGFIRISDDPNLKDFPLGLSLRENSWYAKDIILAYDIGDSAMDVERREYLPDGSSRSLVKKVKKMGSR